MSPSQGQETAKDLLVASIQKWASGQLDVDAESIEVMANDSRLIIEGCNSEYQFDFIYGGKDMVSARCDSTDWVLNLRITVSPMINGYVFQKDFPVGTILTNRDVRQTEIKKSRGAVTNDKAIIGRATTVSVKEGQEVNKSLLNDTVTRFVAKFNISKGTVIDRLMVEPVQESQINIALNQLLTLDTIINSKAASNISEGSLLVKDDILIRGSALFPLVSIARGAILSGDVLEKRSYFGTLPRDVVKNFDNLGRATSLRQLEPNQALRYSDLRPLADISKDDIVTLTVNRGLVTVTIDMRATEQGYVGDQIMLENLESGRLVRSRVTGPGTAERE